MESPTGLLVLAALAATPIPLAAQSTHQVPGDHATIQAAIAAAADGDTVTVAPGTYTEQLDFLGKAILVGSSGGPAVTTVDASGGAWPDGAGTYAAVRFVNGEGAESLLRGFTLTGTLAHEQGPCLWSATASPTVVDCVFDGPLARGVYGGGTFVDCLFDGCGADAQGAGIGGAGYGDGTYVDCTFQGNFGYAGGGALAGTPTVLQCHFESNKTLYGNGGAIDSFGSAIVVDSTFLWNRASLGDGFGGAIHGNAVVSGSLFVGNVAWGDTFYDTGGGALWNPASVDRCTVLDNQALGSAECTTGQGFSTCLGGGIFGGSVTNSIVRGNSATQIEGAQSVRYSNVEGGHPGEGNTDEEPLFFQAGVFPFAPQHYRLRADSPAIDAGDPASPLDTDGSVVDQGAFAFTPTLWSGTIAVELASGGDQPFEVHAGATRSGDLYWVLGSATGTEPGIALDGWTLPLVPDGWFAFTLNQAGGPLLPNSIGLVPPSGIASAGLSLPPGLAPGLVGLELHHAFATMDILGSAQVSGTSDALGLTLLP